MRHRRTSSVLLVAGLSVALALSAAPGVPAAPAAPAAPPERAAPPSAASSGPAADGPRAPVKQATVRGRGGAVSSVDPDASAVGVRVLAAGGNAVDAAVATAAALGVTEPFSAGVGGGGYFVYYDAGTGRVSTIDGRETAPRAIPRDAFENPRTGEPYEFTPDLVTSGVVVGTPGTPLTWAQALRRWGTYSLDDALRPSARLARNGFRVDATFRQQTADNRERFAQFTSTRRLYLRDGRLPRVGSRFRNPALARTYERLGREGVRAFYEGPMARDVVRAARRPPTVRKPTLPVPRGFLSRRDLVTYRTATPRPTRTQFRGLDVYGMAGSSSGGIAVGEALNILEGSDLAALPPEQAQHRYLEATALAFADRAAYVGDQRVVDVPQSDLLSQRYADERACLIDPLRAAEKPVAAGDVEDYDGVCDAPAAAGEVAEDTENVSTTHLSVVDREGNAVAYTLTIEQTGGSGIVVPGRGFLLNNELTDFSLTYDPDDPNRLEPGKRPRSSMSPTIVVDDDRAALVLGSPGGSTIISTVLQVLLNRYALDMRLPAALAAPRAAPTNSSPVRAEQAYLDRYGAALAALGHDLAPAGDGLTSDPFIGAAAAIEVTRRGVQIAAAEPTRRGGGAARVVRR